MHKAVNHHQKGFSLLELLAAVFVLSIALVAIMNLIPRIFFYNDFISNKLIASYLSQEGIELVRNIRDTNWINGQPWDEGIDSGDFEIDYDDDGLSNWTGQGHWLKLHPVHFGPYVYGGGPNTIFKRKIIINKDLFTISVCAKTFWEQAGVQHEVEACEVLHNDWFQP